MLLFCVLLYNCSASLNLWARCRQSYGDLKDSNMLILPSGRQLARYKNAVTQAPGIQQQMLEWMDQSADKVCIS